MTRAWLALGVLTLGVLLIGVDGTVLALAIPFIGRDLGTSATQVLWIGEIYSFVLAGLLVTMGSLGDRIGHKKLLLCGATAFAVASVATAYAPTAGLLIGARALLGVAGATLAPSTLALIRVLFRAAAGTQRGRGHLGLGVFGGCSFGSGDRRAAAGAFLVGLSVFDQCPGDASCCWLAAWLLLPEQRNPMPGPWDMPSVGLSLIGMLGLVYALQGRGRTWDPCRRRDGRGRRRSRRSTLFVRRQLRLRCTTDRITAVQQSHVLRQ